MSGLHDPPGVEEMSAFVDDELPAARRAEVQAHLAQCPTDIARVAAYRRRDEALRLAFDAPSPAALPPAFADRLRTRHRARRARRVGAAALVVLAILSGVWWWRDGVGPETATNIALDAASAYRLYAAGNSAPNSISHTGDPDGPLASRLGQAVPIPNLARFGYRLVAMQLVPRKPASGALLLYQDSAGRRIGCYFVAAPGAPEIPLRYGEDGAIRTFYRVEDKLGYAVVGEIARTELRAIADAVYESAETGQSD